MAPPSRSRVGDNADINFRLDVLLNTRLPREIAASKYCTAASQARNRINPLGGTGKREKVS